MAKNKMLQAVVSLAGTIDPSLGKALDDVTGKLENVNWKAVAVGGAVGGIAVATGKAVVEAGKYLADLGNEYNTAINQLSAATGATGDELDALGESVKNIYAQGLGDDFADVADGLAATQQASDLTGEALERATAAGFNLRDVFDYDVSESARAASALMKNFGIDAEEAYGLIAVGAQNGADKNGDLLDTLNEYSPQFAALGLSADQFIGTLVEGADAGLFSIDKVGDAVKEFNIRAKDGSDTSREAFESLGLNADKMFAAFAAGGDTAEAAFFDTVEALNSMDDPLARNAAGVALFGTQFEDLEAGVLPVLASIETAAYLDDFDHWLRDDLGLVYGRYMDDFYIISSDKLLLREILKKIEAYIKPLGLRLNGKTQIFPLKNGIDFLGFHTYLTSTGKVVRKVRAKSIDNMKRKIRKFRGLVDRKKMTLESVTQSYASWTGHISHGNTYHLRQNMDAYFFAYFPELKPTERRQDSCLKPSEALPTRQKSSSAASTARRSSGSRPTKTTPATLPTASPS